MSEPILKLSTVLKRETIQLASKKHPNGRIYEVINLADLGPIEYAQILSWQAEIDELAAKKRPTRAQKARADELIDQFVKFIVIDLESAVVRELTQQQKQAIVLAWSATLAKGRAEGNARARRTGG